MSKLLKIEEPIVQLDEKITELKKMAVEIDVDMSAEITQLEERLQQLKHEIYDNLQPWDRVQIARHANRQIGRAHV